MSVYELRRDGDKLVVKTPYDKAFIDELKSHYPNVKWDDRGKVWILPSPSASEEGYLRRLLEGYFDVKKECILVAFRDKEPVSVDKIYLYRYSRDGESPVKTWNATPLYVFRCRWGSRNHPEFGGTIIARVSVAERTIIRADKYELFPFSHELQDFLLSTVKKLTPPSDYDFPKRAEWIYEQLVAEAKKFLKEKEQEKAPTIVSTVVSESISLEDIRGFMVVSSLPSKALLEERLPKFFQDVEIGKEAIKIVSGYFYNKLGSLSRKFYVQILPKYTIATPFGYILPVSQVQAFTKEIEELKEEYRKFERDLENFLLYGKVPEDIDKRAVIDQAYLEIVRQYLKEHERDIEIPDIANRVKISLIPFEFSARFAMEILKRSPEYSRLVEETKKEIRDSIVSKINEDINELTEKLKAYRQRKMSEKVMKSLKQDVERILKTSEDFGINLDRAEQLKTLIDELDKAIEGKEVEVGGRLEALLKELS